MRTGVALGCGAVAAGVLMDFILVSMQTSAYYAPRLMGNSAVVFLAGILFMIAVANYFFVDFDPPARCQSDASHYGKIAFKFVLPWLLYRCLWTPTRQFCANYLGASRHYPPYGTEPPSTYIWLALGIATLVASLYSNDCLQRGWCWARSLSVPTRATPRRGRPRGSAARCRTFVGLCTCRPVYCIRLVPSNATPKRRR